LHPLPRIEGRWIEDDFIFISVAPFLVCEGVYAEVDKSIEFQLMPAQLLLARRQAKGRRRIIIPATGAEDSRCQR